MSICLGHFLSVSSSREVCLCACVPLCVFVHVGEADSTLPTKISELM